MALSAIYCAIYFNSILYSNSYEKFMSVIETSSSINPNSYDLFYKASRMSCDTRSLKVINYVASYYATIAFKVSLPIEGIIFSS